MPPKKATRRKQNNAEQIESITANVKANTKNKTKEKDEVENEQVNEFVDPIINGKIESKLTSDSEKVSAKVSNRRGNKRAKKEIEDEPTSEVVENGDNESDLKRGSIRAVELSEVQVSLSDAESSVANAEKNSDQLMDAKSAHIDKLPEKRGRNIKNKKNIDSNLQNTALVNSESAESADIEKQRPISRKRKVEENLNINTNAELDESEKKAEVLKKKQDSKSDIPLKHTKIAQKQAVKQNKSPTKEKKENYTQKSFDENKVLKVSLTRDEKIEKLVLDSASGEEASSVSETKNGKESQKAKGKRGRTKNESSEDDPKPSKAPKKTESKGQSKNDKMPDVTLLDFNNNSTSSSGKKWNLKISSWNVNGIRAWLEKDGLIYIDHESPDIVCIQETKCSEDKLPNEVNVKGYHSYWLSGDQEGYSGVGLLTKEEPVSVKYGIDSEEHDKEGRVITAEYKEFYLVTAYVPNAGRKLVRLDYRMQWDKDFRSYLKKLDGKKPVILCGDLNVAHEEIDLANPKTNKKNAGFTQEERDGFSTLLKEGFVDTFRHLYPNKKGAYTFWTYMMNARAKDVGWRLDYFVISERFLDHLCDNAIRKEVMGSDHCPITLFLSV